jgi:protein-S-isoprenylcysteine O-methyltransferase Ste14
MIVMVRPKLIALSAVLLSGILWLLLAVRGEGGFSVFFANPARTALIIVTFVLMAASIFTQGNLSRGEKEDRGNRWVLWVVLAVGILDGWLPAYSDRTELLTFGGEEVRWAGVILFTLGGILRLWPVFILGRRFSGLVAIQKDHHLVTDGIYKTIRNPSYLGLLISVVGWALAFRSILGLVLAALFVPVLIGRMRSEERLLSGYFGAEYEAYRAHSWRLVPFVY